MRLGLAQIWGLVILAGKFERIEFRGYELVRAEEWCGRKMARDRAARRAYFDREREHRMKGDTYITQILDEEMTPDDPRLRWRAGCGARH